jgi:hypothetical protein
VQLTDFIRHYEPLFYDHEALHERHHRAKRATDPEHLLHLDLRAHGK